MRGQKAATRWTAPFVSRRTGRALRRRDPEAAQVLGVVGRALAVPVSAMLDRGRCSAVVLARQIAIYLIHTRLGRNIKDAARVVDRDRTTGAYACFRVEDLRENAAFDAELVRMEKKIGGCREEHGHARR
jgi:chromosomal replication initiation ATPase DnaA